MNHQQKSERSTSEIIRIIIVVILTLLGLGYFILNEKMLLNALIPPLIFIALDYLSYELRRGKSGDTGYMPNLRIWALGVVLGVISVILQFSPTLKEAMIIKQTSTSQGQNVDWFALGQFFGVLFFLLLLIGFILVAIVKITKGD